MVALVLGPGLALELVCDFGIAIARPRSLSRSHQLAIYRCLDYYGACA